MPRQAFTAGAAKTDITPPLGTFINGDFITHYANNVHDLLYSKALVLQNEDIIVALVVVDICIMPKDFLDEVKSDIQRYWGISPKNILISSTHTHAAGSIEGILLGAMDLPYRKKLRSLIVQSVQKAKQNLRPAKIAFGSADAPEHVVCRRYYMKEGYQARNPLTGGVDKVKTNPIGAEDQIIKRVAQADTQLNYLAVKGIDEQWISILGNYSMHYVSDWPNGTITADYFGFFSSHIAARLNAGEEFVGMLSNGTSGDANIWDFLQPDRYPAAFFKKSEMIGTDLADKVFQSLKNIEWETDPLLSVKYEEIAVPVRKATSQELESAKEIIATTDYEKVEANEDGLRRLYAREQVLLHEYPDIVALPLQAIKIGSGIIGALAGEFFSETGLWLKKNISQDKYFTITMANGYFGYMPPDHEIEAGGYETWRCRTSYLNSESRVRNKLLELTTQLS
ncbi:MAG TPA: neutral/alkaline non-lysosomal ceramidase N-terminal domain-containing protein [Chitinophagaceae bacterium]